MTNVEVLEMFFVHEGTKRRKMKDTKNVSFRTTFASNDNEAI